MGEGSARVLSHVMRALAELWHCPRVHNFIYSVFFIHEHLLIALSRDELLALHNDSCMALFSASQQTHFANTFRSAVWKCSSYICLLMKFPPK